jgi:hypothetical protein
MMDGEEQFPCRGVPLIRFHENSGFSDSCWLPLERIFLGLLTASPRLLTLKVIPAEKLSCDWATLDGLRRDFSCAALDGQRHSEWAVQNA